MKNQKGPHTPRVGNRVGWHSDGAAAYGSAAKKQADKQAGPTQIRSQVVAASGDDPQFIADTDDGKRAAHKPVASTKEKISS